MGWVYPRVGGEPAQPLEQAHLAAGLSPRGRGTLADNDVLRGIQRSIPAWAGNPLDWRPHYHLEEVYPRVGGEPLRAISQGEVRLGLSPRGRGTRTSAHVLRYIDGSIPAWAGNPSYRSRAASQGTVYPRVGGEPGHRHPVHHHDQGLSPRGRGTPAQRPRAGLPRRSIPAWAGNPYPTDATEAGDLVYPRVGGEPSCR